PAGTNFHLEETGSRERKGRAEARLPHSPRICAPFAGRVKHPAHSAALRIASHSRSAWASRGETSGYSGSEPTLGRIFHERAHFFPSARRNSTATPGTSSSRNAAC